MNNDASAAFMYALGETLLELEPQGVFTIDDLWLRANVIYHRDHLAGLAAYADDTQELFEWLLERSGCLEVLTGRRIQLTDRGKAMNEVFRRDHPGRKERFQRSCEAARRARRTP